MSRSAPMAQGLLKFIIPYHPWCRPSDMNASYPALGFDELRLKAALDNSVTRGDIMRKRNERGMNYRTV